jgi:hypothetical protein
MLLSLEDFDPAGIGDERRSTDTLDLWFQRHAHDRQPALNVAPLGVGGRGLHDTSLGHVHALLSLLEITRLAIAGPLAERVCTDGINYER